MSVPCRLNRAGFLRTRDRGRIALLDLHGLRDPLRRFELRDPVTFRFNLDPWNLPAGTSTVSISTSR